MMLFISACACGTPSSGRPKSEGANEVYIQGQLTYETSGGEIILKGTTDLMDGAIVHMSIQSTLGESLGSVDIVKQGDNLVAKFPLPSGTTIYGFMTCAPNLYGAQSKEVYEAYGKKFENLYSSQENAIIWNQDGVIAIFSTGEIKL